MCHPTKHGKGCFQPDFPASPNFTLDLRFAADRGDFDVSVDPAIPTKIIGVGEDARAGARFRVIEFVICVAPAAVLGRGGGAVAAAGTDGDGLIVWIWVCEGVGVSTDSLLAWECGSGTPRKL